MHSRCWIMVLLGVVLTACGAPATATPPRVAQPATIVARHAQGEVRLQQPAKRVIACSEEAADFVIALGLQPVGFCSARVTGVPSGRVFTGAHFFSADQLGAPVFLGSSIEPSIEAMAQLRPDLIVILDEAADAYDQIAQIAPTMVLDVAAPDYWTATLVEVGKALGREAQTRQFISDFDTTATKLRAQLAPIAGNTPDILLIYSFAAADGTMVFNNQWSGAKLLQLLGFNIVVPQGVNIPAAGFTPVSPEIVRDVDADVIMVVRPKTADGSTPRYPIDDLLASLPGPRVVVQAIDPTRASSAPLTDKFVLEEFARLLQAKQ